jgi:type II secretory pathway component GspD/PulD (secretin)
MVRGRRVGNPDVPPTPGAWMPVLRTLFALFVCSSMALAQNPNQKPETMPGATLTMHVVTLSEESFAKLTLDYPTLAKDGVPATSPTFQTPNEMKMLLTRLQQFPDVTITSLPKVMQDSGRPINLIAGDSKVFTTKLEEKTVEGKVVYTPKMETYFDGITAKLVPTVSADRARISLKVDFTSTVIQPVVPLFPVTVYVTPTFEGGSKGTPIPYTQFVQQPSMSTAKVQTTVMFPASAGAVLHAGKQRVSKRTEFGPPVISQIPYINRLFRNVATYDEPRHVLVIVKADLTEVPLAEVLVADYRKAIAEGRMDDAKAFAAKALAADPACFAK